jgi:hypothetical protein
VKKGSLVKKSREPREKSKKYSEKRTISGMKEYLISR